MTKFPYFNKLRSYRKVTIIAPIIFLSLITLYVGFAAENIQELSTRISHELLDNEAYIEAVFSNSETIGK